MTRHTRMTALRRELVFLVATAVAFVGWLSRGLDELCFRFLARWVPEDLEELVRDIARERGTDADRLYRAYGLEPGSTKKKGG